MSNIFEWGTLFLELTPWEIAKGAIEILIIGYVIYHLILFLQRTRAVMILRGIGIFLVMMLLAYVLRLETIFFLLSRLSMVILVALPIVFQPELRRALEQIGRRGFWVKNFGGLEKEDIIKLIHTLVTTAADLAIVKMGALIIIEQESPLDEYAASGTHIGGAVTPELLKTIFFPHTHLHDGAVIVRGDRVLAAGAFLPLSGNPDLPQEVGSRHRSALGITEITDSIAVIVSEETGTLSLAHRGQLVRDIKPDALRELLLSICMPQESSFSSFIGAGRETNQQSNL